MHRISITSCEILKEDVENGFERLKRAGFDGIDLDLYSYVPNNIEVNLIKTQFYSKSIEELYGYFEKYKIAAKKYGFSFVQAHAPFPIYYNGEKEINDFLLESTKKCMAVCKYLECKYLTVHPIICKPTEKELQLELNREFLKKLIPSVKEYGVTICIENLFYNSPTLRLLEEAFSNEVVACEFVDELNEYAGFEAFGFCFDTGHANVLGKDLYGFICALGKRLKILHLHDNNGINDQHIIPFTSVGRWGADTLTDWKSVTAALAKIGYSGAINFETKISVYPDSVKDAVLGLIYQIGKYFQNEIETIRSECDE